MKLKHYLGFKTAVNVFFQKMIVVGPITVPFLLYPFQLRKNDFADNQIFNEIILKRSYSGLIKEKTEVSRIIDLGANIGLSAASFLSEYPDSEVVLVEPDDSNFTLLLNNMNKYNTNKKRAHFFHTAIYNKTKELELIDSNTGSHGYRVIESGKSSSNKTLISPVTIPDILELMNWERVNLIKIDIEGAEKELFERNNYWIGKTDFIVVETHDRFKPDSTKAVFNAMSQYEYKMSIRNQNILFEIF